jgi:hypothetical protein
MGLNRLDDDMEDGIGWQAPKGVVTATVWMYDISVEPVN